MNCVVSALSTKLRVMRDEQLSAAEWSGIVFVAQRVEVRHVTVAAMMSCSGSGRSPRHKSRGLHPRGAAFIICLAAHHWVETAHFGCKLEGKALQAQVLAECCVASAEQSASLQNERKSLNFGEIT